MFYVNGRPYRVKGFTFFTGAERFKRGEDLTPQFRQCRELGVNTLEVFAQFQFMYWPEPKQSWFIADQATILGFTRLAAKWGFRVNWRVLADCQAFGDDGGTPIAALDMSHAQQLARVKDVVEWLKDEPNVFITICNEPEGNGVEPWRVIDDCGLQHKANRPVLMDSGDYGDEHYPADRALDFVGDHPPRKWNYPAEAAKTFKAWREGWPPDADSPKGFKGYENYPDPNIACYTAEPEKYGEVEFDGEDHADTSITNAEQAGAGWFVGGAGACFHSVDGIRARLLGPNQLKCAQAFFGAAAFYPENSFEGDYTHDGFDDWPLKATDKAEEVAGRKLADGTVYGVCALPKNGWTPDPKDGHTVEARAGHGGTLLKMR
jgi:hypothetical protein